MDAAIPLPGAPLLTLPSNPQTNAAAQDELRRIAEEFEAVFLAEMLAPMFESLSTDGLGGGGMGEEIFRPMLVERYAEAIAQTGGVGVAESVMRELVRMQQAVVPREEALDGAAG